MNRELHRYLFWFAHEHIDFRLAEIESILSLFKISPSKLKTIQRPVEHPYWIVECHSESIVQKIASRCVSMKFCMELWAEAKNFGEFHRALKQYPRERSNVYGSKDQSFKIIVETFCKHITQTEKVNKIESLSYLPLEGPVNLKTPDNIFYYIEYYGIEPNNSPEKPEGLFFGRWICNGQRDLIQKLSLKTRKFIGTTSMDPQLSLLMANQAKVTNGDIIFDPFVGTGSLLVAAAQFGGYILGADIDFMMLHARTRPTRITQKTRSRDESVAANMEQYGKSSYYLDVVVSDFSKTIWKPEMRVNAIITDPPYGIREATERVGSIKSNPTIDEHHADTHIPSKIFYNSSHMFRDLLNFAAQHLELNGRLVCWFPVYREHYSHNQLPTHPCLKLIANSEQILSIYASRRLLTYSKLREPQENDTVNTLNMLDFREMYFALRDETRRERRMKQAEERARNKAEWENRSRESTER
ncbi:LOW QUALITY PROTEIN: tRNA (guanine(10)-N2)-methyltransferase homolog [Chelonus insularis]|uniref:LOW QUALITY PROTEIN: tRNA (guanine(10)-N2)-methyltransferase homolog n=1 Tax=Chelonus insularis TaxID=460826 RepID=UPI00158B1351|nr:LOW QUALITY PROTEIN: tRNA (guanine(10)-N2)-methyltransferase homolog [Chelonus insularis]